MATRSYSSDKMKRYFNDPEYRRKRMKKRKWLSLPFLILYFFIIILFGGGIVYWFYIVDGLPPLDQLENPKPELATKVYSSDGVLLDVLAYKNRMRVPVDSLPSALIQALLATEDRDFYSHWGVNLPRFVRQMVLNVVTFRQAGASTITQQLARNLYKLQGKRETLFDKITRKIREFITAVQIERNFTKKEILELYLNVAYFGRNSYGIEAAAQTYFKKSSSQLTMPEYTLLIGMLKGPSYYDPINHPQRAFGRREVVIASMLDQKIITKEMADAIRSDSLEFRYNDAELRTGIAPHFVEMIRQTLSKRMEKYGYDIYRDGLQVFTTLDSRLQRYANAAVEEHLSEYQQLFDKTWDWNEYHDILNDNIIKMIRDSEQYKKARTSAARDSIIRILSNNRAFVDSVKRIAQTIEVGFVVINPHTGEIVAMVGGRNIRSFKYGLNHVTQIKRQPGSAFKPFVYTVAIDNGYPPCYEILNQPVTIPMPDGTRWTPENYDRSVGGKYTLRDALKFSVNLVTVRAILEIAPPKQVVQYAHRMGINSHIPPYESIALGSPVVTPLEITSAYGVFANEGVLVSPFSIYRIEDNDGNVIETTTPVKKEALSRETAYIMTDILKGVVNGGTATRGVRTFFNGPCAGKTGTTNDYADAWFIGFTPQYVAGVWVGFDDMRVRFKSGDGQGGRAAAPIFGRFMQKAYGDPSIKLPIEFFNQPPTVIVDTVCTETKKKAQPYCPSTFTEIINIKYPLPLCDKHSTPDWKQDIDSTDNARQKSKIVW